MVPNSKSSFSKQLASRISVAVTPARNANAATVSVGVTRYCCQSGGLLGQSSVIVVVAVVVMVVSGVGTIASKVAVDCKEGKRVDGVSRTLGEVATGVVERSFNKSNCARSKATKMVRITVPVRPNVINQSLRLRITIYLQWKYDRKCLPLSSYLVKPQATTICFRQGAGNGYATHLIAITCCFIYV